MKIQYKDSETPLRTAILLELLNGKFTAGELHSKITLPFECRAVYRALLYYSKQGWVSKEKIGVHKNINGHKRKSGEHLYEWVYSITPSGHAVIDLVTKIDNINKGSETYISRASAASRRITDDYIRAFFDGEGCLNINKRSGAQASIEIVNTCLPLIEEVYRYLLDRGFHPLIRYRKSRKENYKPYAVVYIQHWDDIAHFFETIGSLHPDKLSKWEELKVRKGNSHYSKYRKRNENSSS